MSMLDVREPAGTDEVGAWPDLGDPVVRQELSPAAVAAVDRLAERWGLTVRQVGELLGGVGSSTWHAWKAKPPAELSMDQLTRVSLLLGIYTALHVIHPGSLADDWVTRPNTNALFRGRTPMQAMLDGGIPTMLEVRRLLDGRRGGL